VLEYLAPGEEIIKRGQIYGDDLVTTDVHS